MPKQAIIGGQTYDFPDDATDAEIDEAALSILGGAAPAAPSSAPSMKTVMFEGQSYSFPADATPDEIDAMLPGKRATSGVPVVVSRKQQRKDDRLMRDMQVPFMVPQSTPAGDPDARKVEQADPGLYAAGLLANIPKSAWEAGKGLATMVGAYLGPASGVNPADVAESVTGLPGALAERYGGIENIKQTVHDDPVGAGLDVAALAGGVRGVKGVPPKISTPKVPGMVKDMAGRMVARTVGLPGGTYDALKVLKEVIAPAASHEAPAAAAPAAKPSVDIIGGMSKAGRAKSPAVVAEAPKPKPSVPAVVEAKPATQPDVTTTLKTEVPKVKTDVSPLDPQRPYVNKSKGIRSSEDGTTKGDRAALREKYGTGDFDDAVEKHGRAEVVSYLEAEKAKRAAQKYEAAKAAKAEREAAAAKTATSLQDTLRQSVKPMASHTPEAPKPKTMRDELVEREVVEASREIKFNKRTDKPKTFATEDGRFEVTNTGGKADPVILRDLKTGRTIMLDSLQKAKEAAASM